MSICGGILTLLGRPPNSEEEVGLGLAANLAISPGLRGHSSRGETHLRGWHPPGTQAAAAARERQRTTSAPGTGPTTRQAAQPWPGERREAPQGTRAKQQCR